MKTKIIGAVAALGIASMPLASFAAVSGGNANSSWTIYGWQNYSVEAVSVDTGSIDMTHSINPVTGSPERERDFIRSNANAANIGFAASIDTGVSVAGTAVKATFQCEQFTFHNRFSGFNDWCNRNSKLGLAGPWGEIMFSQWLTPYNEMTAQWIDPFYDAGFQTHSTNLGIVGWGTAYGNGGFDAPGLSNQGFMRRKPELYQWFSPNWNGFTARVGWSNANVAGSGEEQEVITAITPAGTAKELDPSLLSIGLAFERNLQNGDNIWFGFGYQQHDEWAAVDFACEDSDDETWRIATRYIHDWQNGHSTRISLAYEEMEYDWEQCADAGGLTLGAGPFDVSLSPTASVDFEREAWLISGKHDFPGPWDVRFMYTESDDFDCSGGSTVAGLNCNGISDSSSGAEAISLGLFYTFPAGTEVRFTYGEVDNDRNSANDFGIFGAGVVPGGEAEVWELGLVQWF